ncbi:MAG: hypothetical protein RLZZ293_950 [Pseudomonadota bacterium]
MLDSLPILLSYFLKVTAMNKLNKLPLYLFLASISFPVMALAETNSSHNYNFLLLGLAGLIASSMISKFLQYWQLPTVLGELLIGSLISVLAHYHYQFALDLMHSPIVEFLAILGSILLLFEVGLESQLNDLMAVGWHGSLVALLGMIIPFILGAWIVGDYVFASNNLSLNLFLGATLAATSTGISVRVFKELGIIKNPACQIVLAASIIDDILGLIILTIVVGIVRHGGIESSSLIHLLFNIGLFLLISLLLAWRFIPWLINQFLKISSDDAMHSAILMLICLFWSWLAEQIGLASIIGAFIAGLILQPNFFALNQPSWYQQLISPMNKVNDPSLVHQLDHNLALYQEQRLLKLLSPFNHILVPIFFIYAGMQVDLTVILNLHMLLVGLSLSIVAIIGKLCCGIFLPKTVNRWLVGVGMVPRGEIGLIFALTGRELGVFNAEIFAAILIMVMLTSIFTPLALQYLAKKLLPSKELA